MNLKWNFWLMEKGNIGEKIDKVVEERIEIML
jgi:hypothetical protein